MKRIAICLALSTLPSCGGEATDTSAAVAAGSGESHENTGDDLQEGSHVDENDEPTNAEAVAVNHLHAGASGRHEGEQDESGGEQGGEARHRCNAR